MNQSILYNPECETLAREELEQIQIERLQSTLNRVYRSVAFYQQVLGLTLADALKDYIVRLVTATRDAGAADAALGPLIRYGASPRASINLARASRAKALLEGRAYVIPEDIKAVAPSILCHRILVTYEAEAEEVTAPQIVDRLLECVPVP